MLQPAIIYSLLCALSTVLSVLLKRTHLNFITTVWGRHYWLAPLFKGAYWNANWVSCSPRSHSYTGGFRFEPSRPAPESLVYTCKQWSIHICWIQPTKGTMNAWFLLVDFSLVFVQVSFLQSFISLNSTLLPASLWGRGLQMFPVFLRTDCCFNPDRWPPNCPYWGAPMAVVPPTTQLDLGP